MIKCSYEGIPISRFRKFNWSAIILSQNYSLSLSVILEKSTDSSTELIPAGIFFLQISVGVKPVESKPLV